MSTDDLIPNTSQNEGVPSRIQVKRAWRKEWPFDDVSLHDAHRFSEGLLAAARSSVEGWCVHCGGPFGSNPESCRFCEMWRSANETMVGYYMDNIIKETS